MSTKCTHKGGKIKIKMHLKTVWRIHILMQFHILFWLHCSQGTFSWYIFDIQFMKFLFINLFVLYVIWDVILGWKFIIIYFIKRQTRKPVLDQWEVCLPKYHNKVLSQNNIWKYRPDDMKRLDNLVKSRWH